MDLGIKGRKALVFGADLGIGWHTARLLLAEGATVGITDIDQGRLDAAAARLNASDGQLHAFAADITKLDQLATLSEKVQSAIGNIDVLVQCAGITGAQGMFYEIDNAGWTKTIETDPMGPVRLISTFLPTLRTGGWGRIVLTASEDAVQPYPDEIPYRSAKAGILALSKGPSRTYAPEGVLVNAVSPAFIQTPMTDAMMDERARQEGTSVDAAIQSFLEEERPGIDLKRRGEPDEVANVIAFLCPDRASFVHGSNYRVDAGSVGAI